MPYCSMKKTKMLNNNGASYIIFVRFPTIQSAQCKLYQLSTLDRWKLNNSYIGPSIIVEHFSYFHETVWKSFKLWVVYSQSVIFSSFIVYIYIYIYIYLSFIYFFYFLLNTIYIYICIYIIYYTYIYIIHVICIYYIYVCVYMCVFVI